MDNEPDTQETESREEEKEVRDEDGFSSLIGMLGRQGNRSSGWNCPVGVQSN